MEYRKKKKRFSVLTESKVMGRYTIKLIVTIIIMILLYMLFPLLCFVLVLLLPLFSLKFFGPNPRFMYLQAILPTSTIHSVAMGLAEVEGVTIMKESLLAPIGNIECIGFEYTIEELNYDSEGHESSVTIHQEKKCNEFSLQDHTGTLDVTPERLKLFLPIDRQYEKNQKRYTQRLLLPDKKVVLIGMADTSEGKTVFRYEEVKKIYTLVPSESLNKYNRTKPLISIFLIYTGIFGFIASLILFCDIEYQDGKLRVGSCFTNNINENISKEQSRINDFILSKETFVYK
ncbi:hypothetical protein HQ47_09155 [Porphyromonas macacae]|uniref:RING-type E3 ubiquitin transferase n=1 Tax=Porphyromonas macacae TaxID=28115 RepID=A0A0A2E986_9PORP|nr:hypothetical protein [Porphyromonas macacae]KGN73014.1 hypothetical protein HQ47_09155 [Porphyromonas macacae]SUB89342.1 Uncharacterised protein [Porphyromonas macacae]